MTAESVSAIPEQTVERETMPAAQTRKGRVLLLVAVVLSFIAYSGTLRYEFVYDDGDFIVRNGSLTSWSYLPRYFTEHLWGYRDVNLPGNYYRPLFLLWALINRSLLGLNSTAWHLVTVLTYLATVAMVFWLARTLLKDRVTAGVAALIFGLYPLHIETAAWICGASEPVLALLFIPSFLFYVKYHEAQQQEDSSRIETLKWIALSTLFYAAALFAKETAIILPAIIVAYELIKGDQSAAPDANQSTGLGSKVKVLLARTVKAVKHIIPLIAVSIVYLIIRSAVLGTLIYTPIKLPAITKLLTIPSLLWAYLRLLIWPVGLSEFYDTPYVDRPGLVSFWLPLAAVVLAILALGWAIRRIKDRGDRRTLAFACVWVIVPLLPVLNVGAFRRGDLIHDRYLFLPTMGFAMLIAYAIRKLRSGSGDLLGLPAIQGVAVLILAASLGFATAYQHVDWANDIVLFHRSLSVASGNEIAQNAFGDALSQREMYDEAITVFEGLVAQSPENQAGHYNLGYNYYKVGRYEEALPHLVRALEINSRDERQFLTLGVTLFFLDKYDAAERVLRDGLSLRRDGLGLHYALGAVFKQTGRLEEALNEFNQELAYHPEYVSAHVQIEQITKQIANKGAH